MKSLIAITAALFLTTSANAQCVYNVGPPPLVASCAGAGAGSSGVAFAAPVIATGVFFAYKLGQLYQAGEVQHRKLTRCEWTGEGCGTPEGSRYARFYSVDGK